eukprot:Pompholyxophrys_punicea_v1_NODE_2607_length_367_cov_9.599359.p1 type:complete len:121 gc:universal NODE_2607_length_367_cov_9.599359:365-3(-)
MANNLHDPQDINHGNRKEVSSMFLDWISQLGLLSHSPASNILDIFPLPVKKTLISEVTTFLLASDDVQLLSSREHVLWVMEVIGHAFCMPIEEAPLIVNATNVYRRWLLKTSAMPTPHGQ